MAEGFRRFVFQRGSRGFLVARLQQTLTYKGFPVAVDGRLGPITMQVLQEQMACDDDEFELFEVARRMATATFKPVNAVDLSGHQEGGRKRPVNFAKLKAAGCDAVVIKATEGGSYTNGEAFRQIEAAFDQGLAVSLYIVPRVDIPKGGGSEATLTKLCAEADADAEVANLKRFLGRLGRGVNDFQRIFLDVEHGINTKGASAALAKAEDVYNSWMYAALLSGVSGFWRQHAASPRVGICTARWVGQMYFARGDRKSLGELAKAPLWNMSYNAGMAPERVPDLWPELGIVQWQYENEGRIPGVDGNVDLNIGFLD